MSPLHPRPAASFLQLLKWRQKSWPKRWIYRLSWAVMLLPQGTFGNTWGWFCLSVEGIRELLVCGGQRPETLLMSYRQGSPSENNLTSNVSGAECGDSSLAVRGAECGDSSLAVGGSGYGVSSLAVGVLEAGTPAWL